MAEPDHKAPARPSGLPDNPFTRPTGNPPDAVDDEEIVQLEIGSAIACIEQVKLVIRCLLADSDAFDEAVTSGLSVQPLSWPLPASTYASLLVAIHFLDECAAMLRYELHR
ncbi:hypothetical protein [Dyella nitratireducens]|uniref:DUF3077 domain-containing protein n=1 Tax=Dyella nitratireducens TaxID=1849580 RepID=A0ABQ1FRK7_9GAMM|nr:hypothetical protein [Dyella nitratireducens]GGA24880.1 hypothetical protein GCM10010981_11710 [Dyella nitratireducens]GLQ43767.1 hypothetical protein GCM10007902_36170 [Dyella nitratireducens]